MNMINYFYLNFISFIEAFNIVQWILGFLIITTIISVFIGLGSNLLYNRYVLSSQVNSNSRQYKNINIVSAYFAIIYLIAFIVIGFMLPNHSDIPFEKNDPYIPFGNFELFGKLLSIGHFEIVANTGIIYLSLFFITIFSFLFFLCLSSYSVTENDKIYTFEFATLASLATIGLMIFVSSSNFLTAFLGLELQTLALYIMASINNKKSSALEAALKYFVSSALSTGTILIGISFIYGSTGTIFFEEILVLVDGTNNLMFNIGFVFVIISVLFKLAIFPFNLWAPDLYKSAPRVFVLYFATIPKFASLIFFIRIMMLLPFGNEFKFSLAIVLSVVALISIIFSIIMAVKTSAGNLMSFIFWMSAVNYSVFILLIALTTFSVCNINAIICYSVLYIFSLFALFISIFKMFYKSSKDIDKYIENIRELSGYAKADITGATLFAIYVFCLAGKKYNKKSRSNINLRIYTKYSGNSVIK